MSSAESALASHSECLVCYDDLDRENTVEYWVPDPATSGRRDTSDSYANSGNAKSPSIACLESFQRDEPSGLQVVCHQVQAAESRCSAANDGTDTVNGTLRGVCCNGHCPASASIAVASSEGVHELMREQEVKTCDSLENGVLLCSQFACSGSWCRAKFCASCIQGLCKFQFHKYCHDLQNSTCAKEQHALLLRGPPINVSDRNGFPKLGEEEVVALRHAATGVPMSPKLDGSFTGETRLRFWEAQRRFLIDNEVLDDDDTRDTSRSNTTAIHPESGAVAKRLEC